MPKRNYAYSTTRPLTGVPRKPTKAFFETKCEALGAENDALRAEVVRLQRRVAELEQAALAQMRDMSSIASMRELLAQCKDLNRRGVPCFVRRGVLIHAKTNAPITYYPE